MTSLKSTSALRSGARRSAQRERVGGCGTPRHNEDSPVATDGLDRPSAADGGPCDSAGLRRASSVGDRDDVSSVTPPGSKAGSRSPASSAVWQQLGDDEYSSELGRVVRGDNAGDWYFFPSLRVVPCKPGFALRSGPYPDPKSACEKAEALCALEARKELSNATA